MPLTRLWSLGGYPDVGVLGTRRFSQWQRDYLTHRLDPSAAARSFSGRRAFADHVI